MSAEPAIAPLGPDVRGAAEDLRRRAARWAPLLSHPALGELVKLAARNPFAAPAALAALKAELAAHPGQAVPLEAGPLFPAEGPGGPSAL